MSSLIAELRRRNVFKVGIAYLVIAWLLVQVVVSIEQPLHLPDWVDTLVIVLLAIGFPIALIIAWAFERSPEGLKRTTSPAQRRSRSDVTDVDADQSIAVLPFVDMSPEKDQEYFADGITEELLNSLAQIKDLRVAGRTSSFFFKGKNEDLRVIGEALGVRYLLEGSVRKAGDRVRITAQLIDAGSDRHLWSEQYDRTLDDLFEIQGDIARSVANALEITLGIGGLGSIPGMTRNVAAYDEYLKAGITEGHSFALPLTQEVGRAAVQHLERAVSLDPDFALAWGALHYCYGFVNPVMALGLPDGSNKAEQALDKALALTPDSPVILANLATQKANEGKWSECAKYSTAALEAAARYSFQERFSHARGVYLNRFGRIREAIACYEKARIIEPLSVMNAALLSDAYLATGDVASARAEVDRFNDYSGQDFALVKASGVMIEMVTGDKRRLESRIEALAESDIVPAISRSMRDRLDDPAAALAEIRRMLDEPAFQSSFIKNIFAIWAAYFGDPHLALKLIREFLIENNNRSIVFLVWRAVYRDVRSLPEFKALLEEIGLADFFRATGDWGDYCRPVGDGNFDCD